MSPSDMPDGGVAMPFAAAQSPVTARLRLYIAGSTPNSVRAQDNLSATLRILELHLALPAVEVIDVFTQARRAITDGVAVTPTLIGTNAAKRIILIGDLADQQFLERTLQNLLRDALPD